MIGGSQETQPIGDSVADNRHEVNVVWWAKRTAKAWEAETDTQLGRIEAVRNALSAAGSLGSVDAHAYYRDYDMTEDDGRLLVVVGFEVQQITTY